jgi:structural maintenance of chromosomes protein 5
MTTSQTLHSQVDDPEYRRTSIVGDYRAGSIRRIRLFNFLSYSGVVEFCPGPRLNMVVGPNGTGKSTILNAICLGLGGDPKLLGRADDVRTFISHGESKGSVEIELAPFLDEEPHVIRREIDRNKGSKSEHATGRGASDFFINNEPSNIKEVRQLVQDTYHISIDNLCTFLPQDKVGNFSAFNPQQLLLETEKTLSSSTQASQSTQDTDVTWELDKPVYDMHMDLVAKETEYNSGSGSADTTKDLYEKKTRELSHLQMEKERMEDRKLAVEQLDILKKKALWLLFDKLRMRAQELKDKKTALKAQLSHLTEVVIKPLELQLNVISQRRKEYSDRYAEYDKQIQFHKAETEKQSSKFENHDDGIEELMTEIRSLEANRCSAQSNYDVAVAKLQELQQELDGLPDKAGLEEEGKTLRKQRDAATRAFENAKKVLRQERTKMAELEEKAGSLQRKQASLQDEASRRKERILREKPNLAQICSWIDANRSQFRKPVHGPISCEICPSSATTASYVEAHLPYTTLSSFVVETKADVDLLYHEIRTNRKLPINILLVENYNSNAPVERLYSEQKMSVLQAEHGVVGYLDDTFTAHPVVMQALRNVASVHKVLVGGPATQQSIDRKRLLEVLSAPDPAKGQQGVQNAVIFVPPAGGSPSNRSQVSSTKYQISKSRYSNTSNTRMDDIGSARTLAPGVPEELKDRVQKELQEAHDEIATARPLLEAADENFSKCEKEAQTANLRNKSYGERLQEYQRYEVRLDAAKLKVANTKQKLDALSDTSSNASNLGTRLMSRVAAQVAALEEHSAHSDKLLAATVSAAGCLMNRTAALAQERSVK